MALPDGRIVDDFWQVAIPDFVAVFARTDDGRVLCERQYKHGPRRVVLTLPAGAVEPGEEPLAAARRELMEETGHAADDWRPLGSFALGGNLSICTCHAFLAFGARKVAEPASGDLEAMSIELLDDAELTAALAAGAFGVVSDAGLVALGLLRGRSGAE